MTKEQKEVQNLGHKALGLFWHLRNICYSDKSCNLFDEMHDNILYQAEGINESINEFEYDFDVTYESEFRDALDLALSLKKVLKTLKSVEKINWIYC